MTLGEFCEKVVALCLAHGATVSSWVRSPRHNLAVGGVPLSLHRLGLAADVVLDPVTDKVGFLSQAERLGLWVLDEGDHLHLQPKAFTKGA